MNNIEKISGMIRTVPDFPKKGIMFRDITTAIKDADTLKLIVDEMYEAFKDDEIDYIAGLESRGFIFGVPLAYKMNCGFIPIRKQGKLPAEVVSQEYELEYGTDKIEIHKDALNKDDRVLVVDDLLATGGTASAAFQLISKLAKPVGACFLLELSQLNGSEKLPKDIKIVSLIKY